MRWTETITYSVSDIREKQGAVVREHDSAFSLRIQRIMQMSPPLPSLIIRARVSESFARASSGI